MKSETISFTGRLTLADSLDIVSYRRRLVIRDAVLIAEAVASLFFLALLVLLAVLGAFKGSAVLPTVLIGVLLIYYPWGWWLAPGRAVRRHYRVNGDKIIDHTVTIEEDAISSTSEVGHTRLQWNMIQWVETPRGLMFLLGADAEWLWLPQRLFERNGLKERVLDLARKHSIPIRTMKR